MLQRVRVLSQILVQPFEIEPGQLQRRTGLLDDVNRSVVLRFWNWLERLALIDLSRELPQAFRDGHWVLGRCVETLDFDGQLREILRSTHSQGVERR
jgi:hypothetical protein